MDTPTLDITAIADAVEGCSLPKPEWTHQAHLAAGLAWVQRHGLDAAIPHARRSIRRYNEATGVANTDTGGYHETITRYYLAVLARHAAVGNRFADVLADPAAGHDAVLHHWSRKTLFSVAARRDWVPPDRVPLVA
jgi:hypothetical protein